MRDLVIRIAVSALVGATISGGILYFAFDQSLRGIQTAVQSTNERITDNGEWLRTIKSDIDSLGEKLGEIGDDFNDAGASQDRREIFNMVRLARLTDEIAVYVELTSGLAMQISEIKDLDPQILAEIKAISTQLQNSEDALRRINFVAPEPRLNGNE